MRKNLRRRGGWPGVFLAVSLALIFMAVPVFCLFQSFFLRGSGHGGLAFTLQNWRDVLSNEAILRRYFNSLALSLGIVLVFLAVSALAGFALAIGKVRFWRVYVVVFSVFAIMPIQVVLVPNYLVLNGLGLLNSWWALFLPAVFMPLGAVWMFIAFSRLPAGLIEAGRLDGTTPLQTLTRLAIPNCKSALCVLGMLCFADSWNMVEQPLVFLYDTSKYPISVFLSIAENQQLSVLSVCGVIALIPILLIYLLFVKWQKGSLAE